MAVYGYVQPFREKAANILEVVFSIDVIILLLLKGTTTVNDALGMPSITYSTLKSNSSDICTEKVSTIKITAFSWLLFPFYYFCLVITCAVAIVWTIMQMRYVSSN